MRLGLDCCFRLQLWLGFVQVQVPVVSMGLVSAGLLSGAEVPSLDGLTLAT